MVINNTDQLKPRLKDLKVMFPTLEVFWHFADIPQNYLSKSELKARKKWNNQSPVAVKGNSKLSAGYYLLYKADEQ